jgi:quinol monooxygenase YgiN
MAMSAIGTLTRWTAQTGQDTQAGDLLRDALPLVMLESGTLAWLALRYDASSFGAFACFPSLAARQAHLDGAAQRLLKNKAPLVFDGSPRVVELDVIAEKLPPDALFGPVAQGLQLEFEIKTGKEMAVRELLLGAFVAIRQEEGTTAWFALRIDSDRYGSFAVFPDKGARFRHLTGRLPVDLATHALKLLHGLPDLEMPQVLAAKLR